MQVVALGSSVVVLVFLDLVDDEVLLQQREAVDVDMHHTTEQGRGRLSAFVHLPSNRSKN